MTANTFRDNTTAILSPPSSSTFLTFYYLITASQSTSKSLTQPRQKASHFLFQHTSIDDIVVSSLALLVLCLVGLFNLLVSMEKENMDVKKAAAAGAGTGTGTGNGALTGFSPVSAPRIFWKSRKRSASGRNLVVTEDTANETPTKEEKNPDQEMELEPTSNPELSDRRRALFEPLEPNNGRRLSAESLLPPPDFDAASYPKGWLIGKKRKLVNVDVVESMRRVAVQEMNRKDREINGLNEQLEEDSRCLEHLQIQLLQERSKRAEVERENAMLKDQINMLMNMLQENDAIGDEGADEP